MYGTIANKTKTLKKLIETIYNKLKNSKDSIPYLVKYSDEVENFISNTHDDIAKLLPDNKKYLARWISLKLLEKNTSIYESLKSNFNIDISNNANIQNKLKELEPNLNTICDSIVMEIVSSAENIRKQTCTFENATYNSRDRKIDKILTSKKFGIPIMLVFLAGIFWITITRCKLSFYLIV